MIGCDKLKDAVLCWDVLCCAAQEQRRCDKVLRVDEGVTVKKYD